MTHDLPDAQPSLDDQSRFWDGWNSEHRSGPVDTFMARQAGVVREWVRQSAPVRPRVLEMGCGTGWIVRMLVDEFHAGAVGIDLSPAAIAEARASCPAATFLCSDFHDALMPGAFDVVVSADVIGHVSDQQGFVDLAAENLRIGGTFVLMTQNPFVWNRSSTLMRRGEHQIRRWPNLGELRSMLRDRFVIVHVSSIVPGGDRGALRVVNSRACVGVMRCVLGGQRTDRLYERALVGRELVVIARRRS